MENLGDNSTCGSQPEKQQESTVASSCLEPAPGKSWGVSPIAHLSMGCDEKDDIEEEEILRDNPDRSEPSYDSPIFHCKEPIKGLTHVKAGIPVCDYEGDSLEEKDLATPQQIPANSTDCPGRPIKSRRASPSVSEKSSCRLLFSGSNVSEPAPTSCTQDGSSKSKQELRPKFIQKLQPILSDESETVAMGDEAQKEIEEPIFEKVTACNEEDTKDKEHEQQGEKQERAVAEKEGTQKIYEIPLVMVQKEGGDQFDPMYSPTQSPCLSSSSCSDCEECSSVSVSPLSSPVLSMVKPMSQTIESSPEESLSGSKRKVNSDISLPDLEPPPVTVTESEDKLKPEVMAVDDLGPDVMIGDSQTGIASSPPIVTDVAAGIQIELPEEKKVDPDKSLTPSSVGSTRSNFTVISGITPLVFSSDPSKLSQCRHKHHRHHHHHHHHHHHSHQHMQKQICDNVLTSTPIHKKRRMCVEQADVSSITSTPETTTSPLMMHQHGRPRFSISSELEIPELASQVTHSQDEKFPGSEWWTQPATQDAVMSGSDKENIDPKKPKDSQENLKPTSPQPLVKQANLSPSLNTALHTELSSSSGKCSRPGDSNQVNIKNEISIGSSLKILFGEPITGEELCKLKGLNPSSLHEWSKKSCETPARDLSKEEVEALWTEPENFSDKIWDSLPIDRHASSVDETLFRPGTDADCMRDPCLSMTLD